MDSLQTTCPEVADNFKNVHFVFQKSARSFSKLALDHAREQNNALIKGDGSAVGLTENPVALRRWMIGGSEIARLIQEFEVALDNNSLCLFNYHEQAKTVQDRSFLMTFGHC